MHGCWEKRFLKFGSRYLIFDHPPIHKWVHQTNFGHFFSAHRKFQAKILSESKVMSKNFWEYVSGTPCIYVAFLSAHSKWEPTRRRPDVGSHQHQAAFLSALTLSEPTRRPHIYSKKFRHVGSCSLLIKHITFSSVTFGRLGGTHSV